MDIHEYDGIKASADNKSFSFISTGPKGNLLKVVQFVPFYSIPDSHNLSLGTRRGNIIDYNETTDNGDRNQILSTIFHISKIYSGAYPDQRIFVRGRNSVVTRLYRGAINHEYDQLIPEFVIFGAHYIEDERKYIFEDFVRNKDYCAFLFERRSSR